MCCYVFFQFFFKRLQYKLDFYSSIILLNFIVKCLKGTYFEILDVYCMQESNEFFLSRILLQSLVSKLHCYKFCRPNPCIFLNGHKRDHGTEFRTQYVTCKRNLRLQLVNYTGQAPLITDPTPTSSTTLSIFSKRLKKIKKIKNTCDR